MDKLMKMCLVMVMLSVPGYAYLLGSWEQAPDGCVDWGNGESIDSAANMPSKYQYATVGVTQGDFSLKVIQNGWGQNLTFKLDYARRVEFMNNNRFSIDFSAPASTTGGRLEIYEVVLNTQGGYNFSNPVIVAADGYYFDMWDGSPVRTMTVMFDYDPSLINNGQTPGWVEIVFALNGQGGQTDFYFDNARLAYIPEPATLTLLTLGAATLLRRRK